MNATNSSAGNWQGDGWLQIFDNWILKPALVVAVFAAVISGAVLLTGF